MAASSDDVVNVQMFRDSRGLDWTVTITLEKPRAFGLTRRPLPRYRAHFRHGRLAEREEFVIDVPRADLTGEELRGMLEDDLEWQEPWAHG